MLSHLTIVLWFFFGLLCVGFWDGVVSLGVFVYGDLRFGF